MTTALQDGVYVGLPDEAYFAQPRLGSTDLVKLHRDPAGWWYGSPHNPDREERERTTEMDFGVALHCLVLEGEDAYNRRVAITPYDDFRTKEAREWRDQAREFGQIILTKDMDLRVRHMSAIILNHPQLGPPMRDGMSELVVLFTHEDVQLRAKFDKLLPQFVIDLKSFGGAARGRSVLDKALRLIAERDMDVQRYIYDRAREALAVMVRGGLIHGATDSEVEWLKKVAAEPEWRWCWLFYQRRDDRAGYAPIVQPIMRSPGDNTYLTGKSKFDVALHNYRAFRDRFGLEIPWAVIEQAVEPDSDAFPIWLGETNRPESSDFKPSEA